MVVILIMGISSVLFWWSWHADRKKHQPTTFSYTMMVIWTTLFLYNLVAYTSAYIHLSTNCWICDKPITSQYIQVQEHKMHLECFKDNAIWYKTANEVMGWRDIHDP